MKKQKTKTKAPAQKTPGVIATIAALIEGAKKPKGITKDQIVSTLVKKFPDRNEDSMRLTVNVQVPGRISRERGFKIAKSEAGGFYKK